MLAGYAPAGGIAPRDPGNRWVRPSTGELLLSGIFDSRTLNRLVFLYAAICLISGGVGLAIEYVDRSWLSPSLHATLFLFSAALLPSVLALRDLPRVNLLLTRFLVGILCVDFIGSCGSLRIANACFDRSPPIQNLTQVETAWLKENRDEDGDDISKYYVQVRPWRPGTRGSQKLTFEVGREHFVRIRRPGIPIAVLTRRGRFGWEWLEGIMYDPKRLEPEPPIASAEEPKP